MSGTSPNAYYVRIATDGTITDHGIAVTVPTGATAVTKEQYETVVAALPQQCRLLNGILSPIPLPTPASATLAQVKAAATLLIDDQAEQARLQFLTPGAGQMLEYQATADDAARALAATAPLHDADYPWLAAEKDALHQVGTEVTLLQVAQQVTLVMQGWAVAGSAIKEMRRSSKMRVAGATTIGGVQDVLASITWPIPPG